MAENTAHLEVEIKLEAPHDAILPSEWPAPFTVESCATFELEAKYFDTPERRLAKMGVAVRRRTGGHDAGWHVKQRVDANTQYESLWELSEQLPTGAAELIEQHAPGAVKELEPVAQIRTQRTAVTLTDNNGAKLFEIADDTVWTFDAATGTARAWREWEIEALTAEQTGSEELRRVLEQSGAYTSLADSKIARAVGALLTKAAARGASPEQLAALAVLDAADKMQAQIGVQLAASTSGALQQTKNAESVISANKTGAAVRINRMRELAHELSGAADRLKV